MGKVYSLDDAKARRLGGRTMLIPTVEEVRAAIAEIPTGATRSTKQIRKGLAEANGAEVTCPYAMRQAWIAVASADEVPWWRVTRDGKAEPRLPGGEATHRARLAEEGVCLK